ncbi:GDSL-like lipase/acylhydrolase domain protein [Alcanivorax xiamenensis]|uniref:GDSL-like lipase/acylhydrolase domain protein n=1 Tax=Alcanivorax xiamenensis TaxID=1177156 RepID=A0ABQ6YCS2_9GAMM|nr:MULTISPECIES: SGNH/GDSL hydrolase family protein [Alcanivorax]KAF0808001.1 GDSL-like lipase/acylhydrolase domain protein [Alcanivorax xiamenensis]
MIRFWLALLLLSPWLLWQARRTRATTPRLPEAGGEPHGLCGDEGPILRLLVVGESTAAGVGVQTHDQGLAAHLAEQLSARFRRPVGWQTVGINGIRAAGLLEHLVSVPPADLAIISLGVNDTTSLTRRHAYRQALSDLIVALRSDNADLPIYILAVPPMQRFTALPRPLRDLLGWRAQGLDRVQRDLARALPGVRHLVYPLVDGEGLLAEDGYHPSARGYAYIAGAVADGIREDRPTVVDSR